MERWNQNPQSSGQDASFFSDLFDVDLLRTLFMLHRQKSFSFVNASGEGSLACDQ
jgi:hypothetical protein